MSAMLSVNVVHIGTLARLPTHIIVIASDDAC